MEDDFLHAVADPPDAEIDIVAVHGLNPSSKSGHAMKTWTKDGKLWLRDFLPSKIPKARIMICGYNANLGLRKSTAGIHECANKLLGMLHAERCDDPHRPLVFVCHSLGGIVVKDAIVEATSAADDPDDTAIRKATYGFVFFGTPHDGSEFAELGKLAANMAGFLLNEPDNTFLQALSKDSLLKEELRLRFRNRLLEYHALSFYETKHMPGATALIVNQRSAELGLPKPNEKSYSLPLNHASMCKFASPTDQNYKFVEAHISKFCRQAVLANATKERLDALDPLQVRLSNPRENDEIKMEEA